MDCGYPCGGKVPVGKNLKQLKRNEWDVLPIPLNCLTKEGLDLKKINGPFLMSTDGKLQIELGDVKLLKLAEGDKGCAN
jgi:beta-glucosidase